MEPAPKPMQKPYWPKPMQKPYWPRGRRGVVVNLEERNDLPVIGSGGNPDHEVLKAYALRYLAARGFTEDQVAEEYVVRLPWRDLVVDAAGVGGGRRVAVEVGTLSGGHERLSQLGLLFDEVHWFPYGVTHADPAAELRAELSDRQRELDRALDAARASEVRAALLELKLRLIGEVQATRFMGAPVVVDTGDWKDEAGLQHHISYLQDKLRQMRAVRTTNPSGLGARESPP